MLIGSLAWIAGYYYSILRGDKRPVSIDFIRFIRSQQVERMTGYLRLRKVPL
jgi:hypothetical protein